eukprot:GILJ01009961.1.p1 GENE.GILJ01009961.1~~GILJ01009961.1.p1  ORF type:complete len:2175 (+),score=323.81 GILJ01009961.1:954-6527(+)
MSLNLRRWSMMRGEVRYLSKMTYGNLSLKPLNPAKIMESDEFERCKYPPVDSFAAIHAKHKDALILQGAVIAPLPHFDTPSLKSISGGRMSSALGSLNTQTWRQVVQMFKEDKFKYFVPKKSSTDLAQQINDLFSEPLRTGVAEAVAEAEAESDSESPLETGQVMHPSTVAETETSSQVATVNVSQDVGPNVSSPSSNSKFRSQFNNRLAQHRARPSVFTYRPPPPESPPPKIPSMSLPAPTNPPIISHSPKLPPANTNVGPVSSFYATYNATRADSATTHAPSPAASPSTSDGHKTETLKMSSAYNSAAMPVPWLRSKPNSRKTSAGSAATPQSISALSSPSKASLAAPSSMGSVHSLNVSSKDDPFARKRSSASSVETVSAALRPSPSNDALSAPRPFSFGSHSGSTPKVGGNDSTVSDPRRESNQSMSSPSSATSRRVMSSPSVSAVLLADRLSKLSFTSSHTNEDSNRPFRTDSNGDQELPSPVAADSIDSLRNQFLHDPELFSAVSSESPKAVSTVPSTASPRISVEPPAETPLSSEDPDVARAKRSIPYVHRQVSIRKTSADASSSSKPRRTKPGPLTDLDISSGSSDCESGEEEVYNTNGTNSVLTVEAQQLSNGQVAEKRVEEIQVFRKTVKGDWHPGKETAGGCCNFPTWRNNDQFIFRFPRKSPRTCHVTVTLSQSKPLQRYNGPRKLPVPVDVNRDNHAIGFYVAHYHHDDAEETSPSNKDSIVQKGSTTNQRKKLSIFNTTFVGTKPRKFTIGDGELVDVPNFVVSPSVTFEFNLAADLSYIIIPCTYYPGIHQNYELEVLSDECFELEQASTGLIPFNFSTTIDGSWRGSTAGGCFPNYATWRNNPQFRIKVEQAGHALIVLNQIPASATDNLAAIGFMIVSKDTESGLGWQRKMVIQEGDILVKTGAVKSLEVSHEVSLRPHRGKRLSTHSNGSPTAFGVRVGKRHSIIERRTFAYEEEEEAENYSDLSEEEDDAPIVSAAAGEYILIPFTFRPDCECNFTLSIYCETALTVEPVPELADIPSIYTKSILGSWDEQTAGGCYPNYSTWHLNPQYVISVTKPTRFLALLQQEHVDSKLPAVGMYVVKHRSQIRKSTMAPDHILERSEFIAAKEVNFSFSLSPSADTYLIIPSTFCPATTNAFKLFLHATEDFSLEPVQEHSPSSAEFHTVSLSSSWKGRSAGGCYPNFASWRFNPNFTLSYHEDSADEVSLMLTLNVVRTAASAFPIGMYVVKHPFKNTTANKTESTLPVLWRKNLSTLNSKDIVASTSFAPTDSISCELVIRPQEHGRHFLVIPSTFLPNQEAEFTVSITSSSLEHLSFYPIETDPLSTVAEVTSEWGVDTAGGCYPNNSTWRQNPQLLLTLYRRPLLSSPPSLSTHPPPSSASASASSSSVSVAAAHQSPSPVPLRKSKSMDPSAAHVVAKALIVLAQPPSAEQIHAIGLYVVAKKTEKRDNISANGTALNNSPRTQSRRSPSPTGTAGTVQTSKRLLTLAPADIVQKTPFGKSLEMLCEIEHVWQDGEDSVEYTLLPATFKPNELGPFTVTVVSNSDVTLSELPSGSVDHSSCVGSWVVPQTAGGCYPNNATWRNNPSYMLRATKPGRVVLMLKQEDDSRLHGVGINVLRLDKYWPRKLMINAGDVVVSSGFQVAKEVGCEVVITEEELQRGPITYSVLPTTFKADLSGAFTLSAYHDGGVTLESIDEQRCKLVQAHGKWEGFTAGGSHPNTPTWDHNPKFVLTVSANTMKVLVIVSLSRQKPLAPVGLSLFALNNGEDPNSLFADADRVKSRFLSRVTPTPTYELGCDLDLSTLDGQDIVIVPWLMEADRENEFTVIAASLSDVKLTGPI